MPFGLCNAPATFQRCMMAIFSNMVEKFLEVFMDDFSVFGDTELVLCWCEETNLVLNWEKCHFMVCEGIVLGHKISQQEISIDKEKIEVIEKLPPFSIIKGICSFLSHARFYKRFIKDFSKISKPLMYTNSHHRTSVVTTLIVIAPNWNLLRKSYCDSFIAKLYYH
ncbi:Retrovirus-related Pol polyprotein from transposon 17.6 [Gossypium australe]|uniref:Retrovirus-related Pol polyprotein from transposon 17.6 n=1 Tax=Gossypium australe TaxID=47621 RepID=A0A5B6WIV3_9ROSI|nr:Retrovirus-related Pol polyprotein from transposon 17.6 [Gossypium australe]